MKLGYLLYAFQTLVGTGLGTLVLYKWDSILTRYKNNVASNTFKIVLVSCCFYGAFQPSNYGWAKLYDGINPFLIYGGYLFISIITCITSLILRVITISNWYKEKPEQIQYLIAFLTISLTPLSLDIALSPITKIEGKYLIENLSFDLWAGASASVIYLFFTNYTRKQTLIQQEKELQLAHLKESKTKAELDALYAKINPHFLYNSLNALAGLALENGKKASELSVSLSKLFRYSLNKDVSNFTTIALEIEMTKTYLSIEKIRFEEKLQYSFEVEEEIATYKLPKFLLQPLVENAIKHGYRDTKTICTIIIKIKNENDKLYVIVSDNGIPFPDEINTGYGLQSTYDKLSLLYPNNHEVNLSNNPKQIVITIAANF